MYTRIQLLSALSLAVAAAVATQSASAEGITTRVSVRSDGTEGNRDSGNPVISSDGRIVAFDSSASNLVAGDSNGARDIFVHNRSSARTTRISVGPGNQQGNDRSSLPSISPGGRYVTFGSGAFNLVTGDTNGVDDIFVRDRQAGATSRVSLGAGGRQANSASVESDIFGGGRLVAFESAASNLVPGDANDAFDVFVHDRQAGATTRISVGPGGRQSNGSSFRSLISADGRAVAFASEASNLVPRDTNGDFFDVFVHELAPAAIARAEQKSE